VSAVLEAREPSARYLEAMPPTLVRQFDLLATAPGGVARLRELILSLAVQGKLVEQRQLDGSATVLMREIEVAKKEAASRARVRVTTTDDDLVAPFALPGSWAWVRLGSVTDISGGVTLGRKGVVEQPITLPYLRVANVQRWTVLCEDLKTVTIGAAELGRYQLRAGDLLIIEGGDWDKVGRTAIWNGELPQCLHQNHVFKARGLTPSWNSEWAQLYLNSGVARAYFASCSKQTTNLASINMTQLKACAFPLPPIAEQARIVTRVEELMRLCDALETKGRLEAEQHARLLGTLLGTLTDSSTPEELVANWQRVADHFDLLLDRPEAVDALEQTILQLAVRGLLVPQGPSDESASALLARIANDRSRLIAEGHLAKRGAPEATVEIDAPFDLPASWRWAEFADYIHELCTGPFGSVIHKEDYVQGGVPLINPSHMIDGGIRHDPSISIPPELANQLSAYRLSAGDVLMARRGEVGRYALVTEHEEGWLCGTGSFFVRLPSFCNREYFGLMLEDPRLRAHLLGESIGTTMTNLNQRILLQAPIAVPPLPEQARIVARVTELRRLCAELRQRLATSQTTQSHLAEALVESAVA
jgi:type I restriction enzyme S subunit